ncbi:DUF4355 domain-containing protein [Pediococcus pentosaceus]|uniref:DUF4355 domain-containing protein n=1 Tax=Pediococcus pentosaceus TaxID=1255 RepID=UPI0018FF08D3|nr:DUF4355 domain-containing protein [Pediococcus pentosaceus]MBF7131101.1 DUF4355 domain-containing protein [Pediococcus pentosaceus]
MEKEKLMPMNLQFFAEPSQEPKPTPEPEPEGKPEADKGEPEGGKTFTRDDIAKMISAEKDKWQKEHEADVEEAKNEAAKLAKMSAKEREDAENQKKLDDIAKREANLNRRELEVATKTELVNSDLPESFLDVVIGKDAETTKENIKKVKELFDKEVQAEVTNRLKTDLPKAGSAAGGDSITARIQQNLSKIK